MTLSGKVAIITGAGRGIGAATATKLAELGVKVAVNDISEEQASEVVLKLAASGRQALAVAADVTDPEAVMGMVERVVGEFGGVDVLVNNAGGGGATRTFEE